MFKAVEKLIHSRLSSIEDEVSELESDLRKIQERLLVLETEKETYISCLAFLFSSALEDTGIKDTGKKRGRPAKKKEKVAESVAFVTSEVEDATEEEADFQPAVVTKQVGERRKFVPIPRQQQSYAGVKAGRPEDIGVSGKR